jgi:hypothetical protein
MISFIDIEIIETDVKRLGGNTGTYRRDLMWHISPEEMGVSRPVEGKHSP